MIINIKNSHNKNMDNNGNIQYGPQICYPYLKRVISSLMRANFKLDGRRREIGVDAKKMGLMGSLYRLRN